MVRRLRETGTVRSVHAGLVERDLREGERCRRAHLRVGAPAVWPRRIIFWSRGSVHRLAIGEVAGHRRERARLQRRPVAVPHWARLPHLRRRERRRQSGRLLDQCPQGIRVCRYRPVLDRPPYRGSVLPRQGRTPRERFGHPVVGRQLRARRRREFHVRRDLLEVFRRRGHQPGEKRPERLQRPRLHGTDRERAGSVLRVRVRGRAQRRRPRLGRMDAASRL